MLEVYGREPLGKWALYITNNLFSKSKWTPIVLFTINSGKTFCYKYISIRSTQRWEIARKFWLQICYFCFETLKTTYCNDHNVTQMGRPKKSYPNRQEKRKTHIDTISEGRKTGIKTKDCKNRDLATQLASKLPCECTGYQSFVCMQLQRILSESCLLIAVWSCNSKQLHLHSLLLFCRPRGVS